MGMSNRKPGLTPLMRAAQEGQAKAVVLLLEKRATPHAQDEDGMTPLHFAALAGCQESCAALLLAGANAGVVDDDMRSSLACVPAEYKCTRKEREAWEKLLALPSKDKNGTTTQASSTPKGAEPAIFGSVAKRVD